MLEPMSKFTAFLGGWCLSGGIAILEASAAPWWVGTILGLYGAGVVVLMVKEAAAGAREGQR